MFAVTGQMKSGHGTARIRVTVTVAGDGSASGAGAQTPQAARPAQPARARAAAARAKTDGKTDDLASARRACTKEHAGRYDPQNRITWYDRRYSSVYFDCLARRTGASKAGR